MVDNYSLLFFVFVKEIRVLKFETERDQPAARQGHPLPLQPPLQTQPFQRPTHSGPQAQNFSQKWPSLRQEQPTLHPSLHWQGW